MFDGMAEHRAITRGGIDRLLEWRGHAEGYTGAEPNFKA